MSPLKPYVPSSALCLPPRYSVLSMAFATSMALSSPLRRPVPSIALYSLNDPLFSSTALGPLHCPLSPLQLLSPLWPSVLSTALCLLYSSLSTLWPIVPSTAICSLYGLLFSLRPTILSMALCSLTQAFVPSTTVHCPFYGPLSPLQPSVPL
jgi:hypothetical protein